jgi:DNA polymerase III delta prime subunit
MYTIFVTNKPEKLSDAFLTRCTTLHFDRLPKELIESILINVAEYEGMLYKKEIIDLIAEESNGVPRTALVYLNQISAESSWDIDLAKKILIGVSEEENAKAIELCRELSKGNWKTSISIYNKLRGEISSESMRIIIAGYFASCLKRTGVGSRGKMYSKILDIITVPIYEAGKPGEYRLLNYIFKIIQLTGDAGRTKGFV